MYFIQVFMQSKIDDLLYSFSPFMSHNEMIYHSESIHFSWSNTLHYITSREWEAWWCLEWLQLLFLFMTLNSLSSVPLYSDNIAMKSLENSSNIAPCARTTFHKAIFPDSLTHTPPTFFFLGSYQHDTLIPSQGNLSTIDWSVLDILPLLIGKTEEGGAGDVCIFWCWSEYILGNLFSTTWKCV